MQIEPAALDRREAYRLLTACVIPRPVAWVSTIDANDRPNLAPFSFFGGVTSDPPTLMLSVGRRKGARKDSSANLLEVGEAVVHIPTRPLAEAMVHTSAEVGPEVDEFELAGLARVPATYVRPFRLSAAAIAMEAKVVHHQEVGRTPLDMFLLEVVLFHLADDLLRDGLPDASKLEAVGRLGGLAYCDTSAPFDIPRPDSK